MADVEIVDFGGQLTDLLRRICEDELNVSDVEIVPADEYDEARNSEAVILSGSPRSVDDENVPYVELEEIGSPIMGVCFGLQYIADFEGGQVGEKSPQYGNPFIKVEDEGLLFEGVLEEGEESQVLMSHGDSVLEIPPGYQVTARSSIPTSEGYKDVVAAIENDEEEVYAVQFHPEAVQTVKGPEIVANFLGKADIGYELDVDEHRIS